MVALLAPHLEITVTESDIGIEAQGFQLLILSKMQGRFIEKFDGKQTIGQQVVVIVPWIIGRLSNTVNDETGEIPQR